jgi:hypothetical protein
MSDRVIVTRSLLENVASSIRKKTNTDKTLTLKGMAEAVDGMEYPPSYDGEYTITENGTYKTGGKKMDSDLTVNVASSSKNTLKTLLDATKNTDYLFQEYKGTSVDGLISYEDTSNVTRMLYMFDSCTNIKSIPLLNTSNVEDTVYMFLQCANLESIPMLDMSNATNMEGMFAYCTKLTEIHMTGMKVNFNISYSTEFTREALLEIINNCQDLTGKTSHRITMGSTNLAKLTDEDKLIATNKNWTLA